MPRRGGGRRGGSSGRGSPNRRRRLHRRMHRGGTGTGEGTPPQGGPPANAWASPQDLSAAMWTKFETTVTVNAIVAPDGTTTADKLVENAVNGQHYVRRFWSADGGVSDNQPQTVDLYVKKGERTIFHIRSKTKNAGGGTSRINLTDGTVQSLYAGHTLTIEDMGNGWWYVKCTLDTSESGAAADAGWYFHMSIGSSFGYQGDSVSGLYLWDLKFYKNYNGEGIEPLYEPSVTVPPPNDPYPRRMRVGMWGQWTGTDFVKHPGGYTQLPKWGAAINIQPTPANIANLIAKTEEQDMMVFINLAGNKPNMSDANGDFNFSLYEARVRRFTVAQGLSQANADALADMLARRKFIFYCIDEPFHNDFNDTITGTVLNNQICGLHKTLWPNSITCVRASARHLQDTLPGGGWTKIDYGWSQYEGQHVPSAWSAIGRPWESPETFFTREKADFAAMNLGMVAGLNVADGGWYQDQFGVNACWDYLDTGSSNGYIVGTLQGLNDSGTKLACGTRDPSDTRMMCSPDVHRLIENAIWDDPDILAFGMWCWPSSSSSSQAPLIPVFSRLSYSTSLGQMITKCFDRPVFNGIRVPK